MGELSQAEYMLWAALDPSELEPEALQQMASLDQRKLDTARKILTAQCEWLGCEGLVGTNTMDKPSQADLEKAPELLTYRGSKWLVAADSCEIRAIRYLEKVIIAGRCLIPSDIDTVVRFLRIKFLGKPPPDKECVQRVLGKCYFS